MSPDYFGFYHPSSCERSRTADRSSLESELSISRKSKAHVGGMLTEFSKLPRCCEIQARGWKWSRWLLIPATQMHSSNEKPITGSKRRQKSDIWMVVTRFRSCYVSYERFEADKEFHDATTVCVEAEKKNMKEAEVSLSLTFGLM
jgi:hypothetical protein